MTPNPKGSTQPSPKKQPIIETTTATLRAKLVRVIMRESAAIMVNMIMATLPRTFKRPMATKIRSLTCINAITQTLIRPFVSGRCIVGPTITIEHDVQTQEATPREQAQTGPAQLRGQQTQPEDTPDRLRAMQTKSSPALAQLWLSPQPEQQPVEDFRAVRSKLRHNNLPLKPAPVKKDKTVEDIGQARVKLCHYSPPPQATSTKGGTSVAGEGLRKIRSQAQLAPARTTGRIEEARQTTIEDKAGAVSGPPPPSYGIFSVKGKSLERIEPSAMDKKKGQEVVRPQTESQPAPVSTRPQQPTVGTPVIESQDHQSDWKEKYIALKSEVEGTQGQAGDIGLEGLTIVLHMKGKDDLVINTDLRDLESQ
ncbi:hypothetical protein SLS53_007523 [Cytospora paraplurivora]|uniref:Uncharacterized protein n=1 Tax=Cytospora paraplurivora TaxID=2898453 RepID=A0AAN9YDU4_9PEZI